jgi:rare lipoprotein A
MTRATSLALLIVALAGASVQCVQGEDVASWYGEEHRGLPMANGEPFNPDAMTCASWFYRFGTRLVVTSGGKSVIVTVTDRGPNRRFLKTRRRRIIDLSRAAFARLSSLKIGLIPISVKTLDRR